MAVIHPLPQGIDLFTLLVPLRSTHNAHRSIISRYTGFLTAKTYKIGEDAVLLEDEWRQFVKAVNGAIKLAKAE